MGEWTPDLVAGLMLQAGGAIFVIAALPSVSRRASRIVRRGFARILGGMRPFGGCAWVIDGDTIVVDRVRVRLFGMDAPEMSQAGGAAARARLIWRIASRRVEVTPLDTDVYGRTVASVRCDGLDLSFAMVRDGFARAAPYWSWKYLGTEINARRRRSGLWAHGRFTGIADPRLHRVRQAARRRR